jgi:hypothetical protein
MWPLRVGAGQTQPSSGFSAASQRDPRMALTRGVIGSYSAVGRPSIDPEVVLAAQLTSEQATPTAMSLS